MAASLIRPQAQFIGLEHKFRAYVAGYGAGKTWAGCAAQCEHALKHPGVKIGYFAPTYTDVRDTYFPTIDEVAHDWGMRCDIKTGNKEVHLFTGRVYRTTVICRSMSRPGTIKGFKIGRALVDEIDLMPIKDARLAWRKIIARLRVNYDALNGADVTTTPEGFAFTYQQWVKAVRDKPELGKMYGLIQASTYDNELHLPDDYISSLLASYPANLVDAYINGQFVNLTQGTVYREYDRKLNRSTEKVQPKETLHIGMDFNIGKMAAVVHVVRDGNPHAVDEIIGRIDTPDMIQEIKSRYWEHDGDNWKRTRQIRVYPDASGRNRTRVGASVSDVQLIEEAGFRVSAPKANPPVRNRVNAMNAMFCNAQGERRYFVNDENCPSYAEALEQQPWNEQGEPDKTQDQDHPNDAAGYYIHRVFPVVRPVREMNLRMAM